MRPRRRLAWRLLALAAGLAVVAGWALTAFPAKSVVDAEQGRLEAPSPWLAPGRTVGQTFRARYPNVQAIEYRVAVRDAEVPCPPARACASGWSGPTAPAPRLWKPRPTLPASDTTTQYG